MLPNQRHLIYASGLLVFVLLSNTDVKGDEVGKAGKKYALLVGVSEYSSLRALPGARNDVVDLGSALTGGGFDPVNVVVMTNGSATRLKPTASNIVNNLRDLTQKVGEEDTVLLAFAGHGFQIKGGNGHYFCAADSAVSKPDSMVSLRQIFDELSRCKSRRKVLMIDACRNDPFAEGDLGKVWEKAVEKQLKLDLPSEGNIVAMFSCSPKQFSNEDIKLAHGVFFYYVIRGLLGEAAGQDGIVTVDSLLAYARPQVEKHVRERFNEEQVPLVRTIGEVPVIPLLQRGAGRKVDQLMLEALRSTQANQKKEAIAKYSEAIETNPRIADLYLDRGKIYIDLDNYDLAYEDFSQVLELDKQNADALYYRGLASALREDYRVAIRDLKKALELNPQAHLAANRIGKIYHNGLKDQEKALAAYTQAIEINPGFAQGYFNRAWVFYALEKKEEALSDFDMAVSLDPYNETFRQYRADFAAHMEKFEVALKDGERAKALEDKGIIDSENQLGNVIESNTYILQGDHYYNQGDYDQAERSYQRAGAATERATQGLERSNQKLENHPLLSGNVQSLANRIDRAEATGNISQYKALTDKMINHLPPDQRKEFRQQQQEELRSMREDRHAQQEEKNSMRDDRNGDRNSLNYGNQNNNNSGGRIFGGGRGRP